MKDEKHIRVPIRHTSTHESAALFFSLSPAYPTSHCTLWPNIHNPGKDFLKWGRESKRESCQPDRQVSFVGFWVPSIASLPTSRQDPPELRGSVLLTNTAPHRRYIPLGQSNENECHFLDGLCRIDVIWSKPPWPWFFSCLHPPTLFHPPSPMLGCSPSSPSQPLSLTFFSLFILNILGPWRAAILTAH